MWTRGKYLWEGQLVNFENFEIWKNLKDELTKSLKVKIKIEETEPIEIKIKNPVNNFRKIAELIQELYDLNLNTNIS